MNKALPWNIKGVGFDAREAARESAKRVGLPVGQWLNSVIADRAADLGVSVEDVDPDDRLEAVAARLAGPPSSAAAAKGGRFTRPAPSPPPEADDWSSSKNNQRVQNNLTAQRTIPERPASERRSTRADAERDDDQPLRTLGSRLAPLKPKPAFEREPDEPVAEMRGLREWESDTLLDQAVDLLEKRAAAAIERSAGEHQRMTAAALADVAERINKTESGRNAEQQLLSGIADRLIGLEQKIARTPDPEANARPVREAIVTVADRLGQLESRMSHREVDVANRPIVSALARLEDRFEHLAKRNTEGLRDTNKIEATFRNLESRLADIAQKIEKSDGAARQNTDAEIERIESKLASILDKLNQPPVEATPKRSSALSHVDDLRSRSSGFTLPGDVARPADRRSIGGDVAEITRRQADLERATRRGALLSETSFRAMDQSQRESRLGVETQAEPRMKRLVDQRPRSASTALQARDEASQAAFANLNDTFRALAQRLETRLDQASNVPAPALQPQPEMTALKDDIAGLAGRLESMQHEARRQSRTEGTSSDLHMLRQEIASLSQGLAELAPQRSVATLETAVRDLAGRVESSRLDGVHDTVLAPVERLGAEIREAIHAIDPRTTFAELDRGIKAIARKVEAMQTRGFDPEALTRMQEESREMRDLLSVAASKPPVADMIERELTKLGERVDQLAERPTRTASRDLERFVDDIRGMLGAFKPEGLLDAFDQRIETLAARIDDAVARQPPAELFDQLSRRIDESHASLAARLGARNASPPADMAPLEDLIVNLSGKIDGLRQGSADVRALDGLVRGLVSRIDDASKPNADVKILDALGSQVGRLAERLDRSDANLNAITSLERSIGDLFQQLEETRNATIDAAENAARTAAQDTLRAAMNSPSLYGGERMAQTDLAVEQVSQDVSALREAQSAAEKRANATFLALNQTLERLVDRLVTENQPAGSSGAPTSRGGSSLSAPLDVEVGPSDRPLNKTAGSVTGKRRQEAKGDSRQGLDAEPFLLEPGTGLVPDRVAASHKGHAEAPNVEHGRSLTTASVPAVSPLIAAARRAAQAAQESALSANRDIRAKAGISIGASAEADPASMGKTRAFLAQKRRPILLSLAGLVLLLGALQIVKLSTENRDPTVTKAVPAASDGTNAASKPDGQTRLETPAGEARSDGSAATKRSASLLEPPDATTQSPASSFTKAVPSEAGSKRSPILGVAITTPDPTLTGLSAGLRDLAMRGDASAQFETATRLADGRGVNRNLKSAAVWFQRAADQGLAPAQYRLGSLYEKGLGVTADPAQAVTWYEKAAAQGNIRAMHNLAVMSAEGAGSKPDYAKAATWFTKAANFGVRDSQFNLAILYARGLGLTQDLAQSYEWFAIAGAQGDPDAAKKRDEVGLKLDAQNLATAKTFADGFHPLTAVQSANDVAPPPGGWDAVAPAKSAPGSASAEVRARVYA